jgi:CubicO group peptidase (beta-lactamase class C family)
MRDTGFWLDPDKAERLATVYWMKDGQLTPLDGQIPVDPANNPIPGAGFGLGFGVIRDPAAAGFMSSEGTNFWSGAANTHFWIDPKEDLVVVVLAQDMCGAPGFETLWPQIRTLVYSALAD